jgi:hypothetical protein
MSHQESSEARGAQDTRRQRLFVVRKGIFHPMESSRHLPGPVHRHANGAARAAPGRPRGVAVTRAARLFRDATSAPRRSGKEFGDSTWRVTKQVRRIEQVQGFITSSNGHSALVAISAILSWRVWMIILNRVLSKTATFQYSLLVHCFSNNTSSASYANFILLFRWSANHISSAGSFG